MTLSQNGKWLGLQAWNFTVLGTESGETKFEFPTAGNMKLQFQRLHTVLPQGASLSHVGSIGGASFRGDYLIFCRSIGRAIGRGNKPGEDWDPIRYNQCLRELRLSGRYRIFEDVFDMNEVAIDGSPLWRVEVNRDTPCSVLDSPLHHLYVQDGEIKYGRSNRPT